MGRAIVRCARKMCFAAVIVICIFQKGTLWHFCCVVHVHLTTGAFLGCFVPHLQILHSFDDFDRLVFRGECTN